MCAFFVSIIERIQWLGVIFHDQQVSGDHLPGEHFANQGSSRHLLSASASTVIPQQAPSGWGAGWRRN